MQRLLRALAFALVWFVVFMGGLGAHSAVLAGPFVFDGFVFDGFVFDGFVFDGIDVKLATIPPFDPLDGVTITVTTFSDELNSNGSCSLREAIQAANLDAVVDGCPAGTGKDLILLPAGSYAIEIDGVREDENATGDFDLRSSMVISGLAAGVSVDGLYRDRVFDVHAGAEVEVLGLIVQGGSPGAGGPGGCGTSGDEVCPAEWGGGIANAGDLRIVGGRIWLNSGGYGGVFESSEFMGPYMGRGGSGGGIYNTGLLVLENSMVLQNATGTGGTVTNQLDTYSTSGGDGGGLMNVGHVVLVSTDVSRNSVSRGDGNYPYGEPGGSLGNGGGIVNSGFLTVTEGVIGLNGEGGVVNKGHATLFKVDVVENGVHWRGGAGINNSGTLSVTDGWIRGNETYGVCISYRVCAPSGAGAGILNSGVMSAERITVTDNATGPGGGNGGGLYNAGVFVLSESSVLSNSIGTTQKNGYQPREVAGSGGGIYNEGDLTVVRSTIAANATPDGECYVAFGTCAVNGGYGGGIYNSGSLTLRNSTVSNNRVGSGVCAGECSTGGLGGGIYNNAIVDIAFSTVAFNRVEQYAGTVPGEGNNWYNDGGGMRITGSLFAVNENSAISDYVGGVASRGYNLFQYAGAECPWYPDCSVHSTSYSDIVSSRAGIGPLADNGGATWTHALLSWSLALDQGRCSLDGVPVTDDQRGEPRPQGAGCDIGAFESALAYVEPSFYGYLPVVQK